MRMDMTPRQITTTLMSRLNYLLISIDFDFSEVLTSFVAVFGGLMLLAPPNTFGISVTYTAMRDMMPEWAWGTLLFVLGMAQATALLANHHRARQWLAFVISGVWAFIALTFWISSFVSFGSVVFPALALSAAWAFWRLGVLARGSGE